jgi:hypothetical protein
MIRQVLGSVAFGIGIAVVACSSSTPADKYPTVDSFCTAKADAECVQSKVADACGVTADTCKAARTNACKTVAANAVGRNYTPGLAEDCINKTLAVYQDRVIDPTKEDAYNDACNRVFAGTKNKSDPCTGLYDCSGSLICDTDKGFCADKVEKQLKDFCNNPGEVCATGLYCQQQGSTRVCQPKVAQGQPCSQTSPCLETLRCTNTCVPKAASGEACDANTDCSTNACDTSGTPHKCIARQYASENGSCKDFGASS